MNKKVGSDIFMTVTVLFTEYDLKQLQVIVGTDRTAVMYNAETDVHVLITDDK